MKKILTIIVIGFAVASFMFGRPEAIAKNESSPSDQSLPRMIELGSKTCTPCKLMKKVLASLKKEYNGQFVVEAIDVFADPESKGLYQIQTIPTQVFQSVDGVELFRHEGFFAKEDILAKWKELGYEFTQQEQSILEEDGTLDSLFKKLTHAVESSWWIAMLAAFAWVCSVFCLARVTLQAYR